MPYQKQIGEWGEDYACQYLKKSGYKIVDRNVKLSYKELDIVAKKKGVYVFVEVKTRIVLDTAQAANALTSRKIKYLKKAIKMYVNRYQLDPEKIRLDLVCIDKYHSEEKPCISHYSDIF